MLSRFLAVTMSLLLLVPTCCPDDLEIRPAEAAAESAAAEPTGTPAQLTPEEESSLSARAEEPGPEVAGGALSNLHLTYAVIALAAIILVLLIK